MKSAAKKKWIIWAAWILIWVAFWLIFADMLPRNARFETSGLIAPLVLPLIIARDPNRILSLDAEWILPGLVFWFVTILIAFLRPKWLTRNL